METDAGLVSNPYQPPRSNPEGAVRPIAPRKFDDYGPITLRMVDELKGTKPWVRLTGGLLFLTAILMALGGVALFLAASSMPAAMRDVSAPLSIFYVVAALVYWILASHLWSYGSSIEELVMTRRGFAMEKALADQRRFWKMVGVLTAIAILGSLVVGFIGGFAGALLS